MERAFRVAILSYDGGEYSVRLSSALVGHAGLDVLLVVSEETSEPHIGALDSRVHLFRPVFPRMRQVKRSIGLFRGLLRKLSAYRPDIVHVQHHQFWTYLFLKDIQRHFPVVITVHDPVHHEGDAPSRKTPQWIIHRGYRIADRLVVHAEHSRNFMVKTLGFEGSLIDVVPHIAVSNSAAPNPGVHEEENLILFFGRIWPYKGLEYLIRAEPQISEQVPGAKILIAGEGEDLDRYRKMMVNSENFIIRNMRVPWAQAAEYFSRASVVVLPYVDASSSGVIPVAYSFSKPVVATDVGGLPDMVEHGITGYLVPVRNPGAIAEAVIELLKNPGKRREMGRRGQEKLEIHCGAQAIAKRTVEIYRRTLSQRGLSIS